MTPPVGTARSREAAAALDRDDPLARQREKFLLPDGVIYLDGNSLGPLPASVAARIETVVDVEWGRDLITSWTRHDWIGLPQRVGAKLAALIGARPAEVVCADSTSVNLFKLLSAALSMRPDRRAIVSEEGNFPTDLYVAQGLAGLLDRGHELRLLKDGEAVTDALDDTVAVVMLTEVDYRTGRRHDMAGVTAAVQDCGALMLWDLAHSAGAFPVDLTGTNADFAVGCGYKYLNGGPGAPAFLYVAERHLEAIRPALSGWMGHESPFDFTPHYAPAEGVARHLVGTPPVLSMAALDSALDVFEGVDMAAVREKSVALSELFIALTEERCADHGFTLASPRNAAERGSQVSFRHAQGYPIMQALIARGVIGDFRAPDIVRFGFAPLYLRHVDIWDAVAILADVMRTGAWDDPAYKVRAAVT